MLVDSGPANCRRRIVNRPCRPPGATLTTPVDEAEQVQGPSGSTLEELRRMAKVVRIAALGDLHCSKTSQGTLQPLLAKAAESAELLLLAGDLTDYGLPEEARILARELTAVRVPIVAVLGNHDFESGKSDEVRQILAEAGITILDGDACETHGIGIAGVKGFGGGFGQRALGAVGRSHHQAVRARGGRRSAEARDGARAPAGAMPLVALLHYSPVQQTVEGEPLEIYPFLGSSRLEEPINTYQVSLVVHSHAHRGQLEGTTSDRRARLQRLDAAADARVSGSAAVPRVRDPGS